MTTAHEYIKLADEAFWHNQNTEAIAYCTEAIQLDPNRADAYHIRALAQDEDGASLQVILADMSEAIRLDPQNPMFYWNRAMTSEYTYPQAAIADYSAYIQLKPQDANGFRQRAHVFVRLGDEASAIKDFEKAIELLPTHTESFQDFVTRQKIDHGRLKDYGLPENIDLYCELASAYYRSGDVDKALEIYQQAIVLAPSALELLLKLVEILIIREGFDAAIAVLTTYLDAHPGDAQAYYHRMKIYELKGDQEKAASDWLLYDTHRTDGSRAYIERGKKRAGVGNFDGAIDDYNEALVRFPKSAEAYYYRGVAFDLKNKPDEALADYSIAIMLNNDYIEAYIDRGLLYLRRGNRINATRDWAEVLAHNPEPHMWQDIYGVLYGQRM